MGLLHGHRKTTLVAGLCMTGMVVPMMLTDQSTATGAKLT